MKDIHEDTEVSGESASNVVQFIPVETSAAAAPQSEEILPEIIEGGMPVGFYASDDGIYFLKEDAEGELHPMRICSQMRVVGLCRRPDKTVWGRVVDLVDSDGKIHQVILDETLITGSATSLLRPLVDRGLQLTPSAEAKKKTAELLEAWRPRRRFVRISRLGWTNDSFDTFALADGTVIGEELTVLECDTGAIGKSMRAEGSLETWRDTVAAACSGNPLMLLAVSQAFVGPLLEPLRLEGGGFHFRGASSRGKTTLLGCAASVWGGSGYVQSWRATDNAIECLASCANGSLLALDELHMVAPQVAGEVVYMLANGQGRHRMTTGAKLRPPMTWRVAVLSSGEISLEEHLATAGKPMHMGMDIRLVDIQADARRFGAFDNLHAESNPMLFVEKLQRACADHHGMAGRLFVENFRKKRVAGLDTYERFMTCFVEEANRRHDVSNDGQVLRVIKKFAAAALAGELATTYGLTGWKTKEAWSGVQEVCDAWIEGRDGIKTCEINAALEKSRTYLAAHSDRFKPIGTSQVNIDGWHDEAWFYILPETWALIHGNEDPEEAARLHKAANLLRTDRGATLQLRMGRQTPRRRKVYAVRKEILANRTISD